MNMKHLLIASLLIAVSAVQAGTIKLPGSNITRNAGTSIPVTIQASGFSAGSKATINLVNAKTWVVTPWLFDQPIVNGNNPIEVPIDWSSEVTGTYLVKVNIGNNHCTSTWTVRLRSAVIWPYAGSVFYRGTPGAVTFVVPEAAEKIDIYFWDVIGQSAFAPAGDFVDPASGRWDFVLPVDATPGTYRILIDCYNFVPYFDEEFGRWDWEAQLIGSTQSEKITIR